MPSNETTNTSKISKIYQLSAGQVGVLRRAASGKTTIFAVLTPNPEIDSPETLKRLTTEEQSLLDFIGLGLAEDRSSDFSETIVKCTIDTKRSYRVLALTKVGQLMFDYCDDPDCGKYHPPGDPSKRLPC